MAAGRLPYASPLLAAAVWPVGHRLAAAVLADPRQVLSHLVEEDPRARAAWVVALTGGVPLAAAAVVAAVHRCHPWAEMACAEARATALAVSPALTCVAADQMVFHLCLAPPPACP